MSKFNFIRRKSDTIRYTRAMQTITNITFPLFRERIQKVINHYDTESQLINHFTNHPNLEIMENKNSKDGKVYVLQVNLIGKHNNEYHIIPSKITCQLVGENYVESWRNVGADYHSLHVVSRHGDIDYWKSEYLPFLLEQLENQDKLEEMCEQLNLMNKNYFPI